jgi:hypothetical protein
MIDAFSRWIELYAAPDLTAISAARAILSFIGRFGVPAEIHSDQGTQYLNELIRGLTTLMGNIHTFNIAPYSHELNGIVERANKEILKHLKSIIFEKNVLNDWSDNLPIVQRILNSSTHSSIGYSPAQIVFGDMIDINRGVLFPHTHIKNNNITHYSSWLDDRLNAQKSIIAKAKKLQIEFNENKLNKTDLNDITIFNVGDLVLVDYPVHTPNKLLTNRKGPLTIIHKTDNNMFYTVRDLTNVKNDQVVHISKLHKYIDNNHNNPIDIANRDVQLSEIDSILEHRGNK